MPVFMRTLVGTWAEGSRMKALSRKTWAPPHESMWRCVVWSPSSADRSVRCADGVPQVSLTSTVNWSAEQLMSKLILKCRA